MNEKERIAELEKENEFLKSELRKRGYYFVDKILNTNEKIQIYMDYFKGRNDIYAKRYFIKNKQIYGWSPDCANEFKNGCIKGKQKVNCVLCPISNFIKLTSNVVLHHFKGMNLGIGIYPLLQDSTCYFVALDFDENNWFEDMLSVYKIAISHEIYPLMEKSASGIGGHLWIFFNQPIKALKARKLAMILLQEAMNVNKNLSFSSFDRIFPNQDYLPEGGLGNLIGLPLRYDAFIQGNSAFINELQQMIKNPIEYLSTIIKLDESSIDKILNQSNDDYFFDNDQLGLNFNIEAVYTKELYGKEDIMLCIEKRNLNLYTLNLLRRIASMFNPEYYLLQSLKKPIYRASTPRVLSVYEEDDKYLYLPRGLKYRIKELLPDVKLNLENYLSEGKPLDVSFFKELREYQKEAIEKLLKYEMGVMKAVPGFGKTVMGIYAIASLKVNTLVIVPSKEIQDQWVERIEEFLIYPKSKLKRDSFVCVYNGSKKKMNKNIDIATASSLARLENIAEVLKDYGMVIVDECHHAASNTFTTILRNVRSKYIYSFSATPKREDGLEKIMHMFCGPIRYETNKKQLQASYQFKQVLIPRMTTIHILNKKANFTQICTELIRNEVRNYMILKDVVIEYEASGKIIILSDRIEHLNTLYAMMKYICEHVYVLTGKMKKAERKKIIETVKNLNKEEKYILLASSKLLGEGFDLPSLSTLFLVLPISAETRVTQYTGRIHRNDEGKDVVKVYDYVDIHITMMESMFHKRLKQYQKEGYFIQDEESVVEIEKIVYDNTEYENTFINDIKQAKLEILIMNQFMDLNKIKKYYDLLQEKIYQNVKIYFVVNIKQKQNTELLRYIKGLGAEVIFNQHHKHFIVVDRLIVWYANFDFFNRKKSEGYSSRLIDSKLSEEIHGMVQ